MERRRKGPPPRPRFHILRYGAIITPRADTAACFGRSSAHRRRLRFRLAYCLNRFQYANSIRDLIALEIDGAALLPADDSGYGFDNIGDVLTVSPVLLEKYLSAAATISRLAVGDPSIAPTSTDYAVPPAT